MFMAAPNHKTCFVASLVFHAVILLILILGFDFTAPLIVIENTNKNDVISVVVLGDTQKSKILTPSKPLPPPDILPKPTVRPVAPVPVKKEVIALKVPKKKHTQAIFGKDLLADIEKYKKKSTKHKKVKQKQWQKQFEKTLHQQAEQSMRQQLLNEDIQLKSTQLHAAQGIINKYQALIQQAISEHWVIPPQANKKLYSMLLIRLAPGGVVLDVQIITSSGDTALDNSARAAVYKASPLPVPSDPVAFEPFRQFNLKARPINILNNDTSFAG